MVSPARPRVGVLALQGAFARHRAMLERLGAEVCELRTAGQFQDITHLVLPGGESTTMLKLMDEQRMEPAIRAHHTAGRPILATCAGLILLAREISSPAQHSLGLLDLSVRRNAYGRQIASFITGLDVPELPGGAFEGVFIRAPVVTRVGDGVGVLARHESHPVLLRQDGVLAASFHPELTDDLRLHSLFLGLAARQAGPGDRAVAAAPQR